MLGLMLIWKRLGAGQRGLCRVLGFCLGFACLGMARPALVQASPWTVNQTAQSLKYTQSYALWIKKGTTDTNGLYSGDTVSIWVVNAAGSQTAISATYGPFTGWRALELVPAFDGTLRLAWTKESGTGTNRQSAVSIWTLDASANLKFVGPTYGPFDGWHLLEVFANPDGTSNVYWVKSVFDATDTPTANQVSIWRLDAVGSKLSISPTYGPYSGWFFYEGLPSFNKDGTSFLAWVNPGVYDGKGGYSGDMISLWKTDVAGTELSIGPSYGRYANWTFSELFPAYDGTARLLWTLPGTTDQNGNDSGDTASVWSVDSSGHETSISSNFGPYTGWGIDSIVTAPSSTSRLFWIHPGTNDAQGNYSGDTVAIWALNAANKTTAISPNYTTPGGYSDGLSVFADGSESLTWNYGQTAASNYDSTQFSLWGLNALDNRTATGPVYGPYL